MEINGVFSGVLTVLDVENEKGLHGMITAITLRIGEHELHSVRYEDEMSSFLQRFLNSPDNNGIAIVNDLVVAVKEHGIVHSIDEGAMEMLIHQNMNGCFVFVIVVITALITMGIVIPFAVAAYYWHRKKIKSMVSSQIAKLMLVPC